MIEDAQSQMALPQEQTLFILTKHFSVLIPSAEIC